MVDFDTSSVSPIKRYQSLQKIIISVNQQSKYNNDAQNAEFDYGHIYEKGDSVLPILGVWGLVLDCNRLLAMSGTYQNAFYAVKHALTMKMTVYGIEDDSDI